jgi:hypothetical protein
MGRLLSDLKTEMMDSISNSNSNKPAKKFLAFSCHDTSLAAVLGTLGVFDHKCVPHLIIQMERSLA